MEEMNAGLVIGPASPQDTSVACRPVLETPTGPARMW